MECCKYHPLVAATYHCKYCSSSQCDRCVKEDNHKNKEATVRCHLCNHKLESLGTGNGAVPFWRRLQEAFHYPFNSHALTLIIGISILSTIISSIFGGTIIAVILSFLLTGTLLKYAFRCLKSTSEGVMVAPDIQEAYSGGNALLLQLIGMIIFWGVIIGIVGRFLGPAAAGLIGTIVIMAFPAIIIRFGHSEDILSALDPIRVLQIIVAIGLPYGLLIAFIMIMMGSVGFIHELIGYRFSLLGSILQSMASNYYLLVAFHMMGYMLYQYQGKLGFTARAQGDDNELHRTISQMLEDEICVNLKEGKYDTLVKLYSKAFKEFPTEKVFIRQFFEYAYRSANTELINDACNRYLQALLQSKELDKLNITYKQARQINSSYLPTDPHIRLHLAKNSHAMGDSTTSVRLLNGIQKQAPDFPLLADAYQLLAEAFEEIPNMVANAEKCRAMAKRLKQKTALNKPQKKAHFSSQDPAYTKETLEQGGGNEESKESNPNKLKDLPPIEFKP